jgi:hypothetical protein
MPRSTKLKMETIYLPLINISKLKAMPEFSNLSEAVRYAVNFYIDFKELTDNAKYLKKEGLMDESR